MDYSNREVPPDYDGDPGYSGDNYGRYGGVGGGRQKSSSTPPRENPLKVLSFEDMDAAPDRDYFLKGLISPGEFSVWVGPPKSGKTFILLDVAYRLSMGLPVLGRRVKKARVLYICAEGEAGVFKRVKALRKKYGDSDAFAMIAQPVDLLATEDGNVSHVIERASEFRADIVVLDTLSRMLAGGDENSSYDMGTIVKNIGEVRYATKAHVAVVHHGTKASNGSNPRGHSCLTGATDALIEITKNEDKTRTVTVVHAKDDADGDRFGFGVDVVELGQDADGDPITTLTVRELDEAPKPGPKLKKPTSNEAVALDCLDQAIKAEGFNAPTGPDKFVRPVVEEDDWRRWFYTQGRPDDNQDTRKRTFRRCITSLTEKGVIAGENGRFWPLSSYEGAS